ncbi:unnamed protein product [Prorocentrum cordatum]|uniref:Spindle pole body component n=1 Tax=Prorocentrum cordatum TaxID=2364126 RepID=A0ABN9RKB6_9DINO|nr:unnamed protein product [Polarella glacialis]
MEARARVGARLPRRPREGSEMLQGLAELLLPLRAPLLARVAEDGPATGLEAVAAEDLQSGSFCSSSAQASGSAMRLCLLRVAVRHLHRLVDFVLNDILSTFWSRSSP